MTVEAAANAQDGLARLAEGDLFDAVIVDRQMPDQGGLALAEEIREQSSGRYVPLIALSFIRPGGQQHPFPTSVSIFVHKPIRPVQLLEALCRAMSVQIQRDKRVPATPSLDPDFARRLPLRLLLADDNPINQKVGLSVLQKLGYRADLAGNGLEVLQALERKAYDILFLDVQMPEMDGLEAARQICGRWPQDRRPRIIAMTGNALVGDREKCLQAGMDDYIAKPIRVGELQSALERWGRAKSKKSDTAFVQRLRSGSADNLLDQTVILELRNMPPSEGVGMLQELVDLFLEGAPQRIAQISQSINDGPMLAFHAHALKSMSLNLGAKRIVELSQKLEDFGRTRNVHGAPALLQELESAFAQTKAQLQTLRDQ